MRRPPTGSTASPVPGPPGLPRRALLWSVAERHAGLVITLVSTMVLARLLTPAEVGIFSLCAAFMAVAAIVRDFGVSEYLIQEPELTDARRRAAVTVAFAAAWSMAAVAYGLRHALARYFGEAQLADVMTVLTLHFLLLPVTSMAFALMNRELAFRRIFQLQVACNLAQALVAVALAATGHGVLSLAWGSVANVAMQTLILLAWRPRDCLTLPGRQEIGRVLRFGSFYMGSRSLETLARNVHEPVIGKVFGFTAVGLFSRALGLVEMFNTLIIQAVIRVATPTFASMHRSGESTHELFSRATAILAALYWPFLGFVALMAGPLIELLFGPAWSGASPLATALAVACMPSALHLLAPQFLAATGQVHLRLRMSAVQVVAQVLAVVLAAQASLNAVAWAWSLPLALLSVLYLLQLRLAVGLPPGNVLRHCLPSVVLALCSIGVQASVAWAVVEHPSVIRVTAVAVAGTVSWWLAARKMEHAALHELVALVASLRAGARRDPRPGRPLGP